MEVYSKKFHRFCKRRFNHIGLVADTTICRLIGYSEDDSDCYYIIREIGGKIIHHSMVGPFVSLKYRYPRYKVLESQMSGNWHCPKEDDFILSIDHTVYPIERYINIRRE